METKTNKNSNVLLYGFSFHLILTLKLTRFLLAIRCTGVKQLLSKTSFLQVLEISLLITLLLMSTSAGALGSGSKTKEQVVKRDFSYVPSVEVSAPTRMGNCEM